MFKYSGKATLKEMRLPLVEKLFCFCYRDLKQRDRLQFQNFWRFCSSEQWPLSKLTYWAVLDTLKFILKNYKLSSQITGQWNNLLSNSRYRSKAVKKGVLPSNHFFLKYVYLELRLFYTVPINQKWMNEWMKESHASMAL